MRELIGVLLILAGVVVGMYVGLWVCFIGGIVNVIVQVRAEYLDVGAVAWGVAKVVFAGFFGWLSAIVFILPGKALIDS